MDTQSHAPFSLEDLSFLWHILTRVAKCIEIHWLLAKARESCIYKHFIYISWITFSPVCLASARTIPAWIDTTRRKLLYWQQHTSNVKSMKGANPFASNAVRHRKRIRGISKWNGKLYRHYHWFAFVVDAKSQSIRFGAFFSLCVSSREYSHLACSVCFSIVVARLGYLHHLTTRKHENARQHINKIHICIHDNIYIWNDVSLQHTHTHMW